MVNKGVYKICQPQSFNVINAASAINSVESVNVTWTKRKHL